MKWFKHYTNAHKGKTLQSLYIEFNKPTGYGLYFLFVGYLVDIWDGGDAPEFKVSAADISAHMGIKRFKLKTFLECFENIPGSFPEHSGNETKIFWELNGNILRIKFPKLSEVRHRDSVSSGHRPANCPATGGLEKNKKKKNTQEWQQKAFDLLVAKYREFFPGTELGSKAKERFCFHAKDPETAALIIGSVTHYATHLKSLTWERLPKTSIATYLGAEKSPFWIEYKDAVQGAASAAAGSMRGA